MKLTGIIAEYNPFHNGHQYHINKALEITGADAAVVIMSGDFVQRGTPAIMPKHLRTKMALNSGAALVIELPVPYATGSAEYFATGAVSILNSLGCIDSLCFGSECGDVNILQDLAKILADEPAEFKKLLSDYLKQGNSFPLARQFALSDYLKCDEAGKILAEPNNILGIEYLKAIYRLNSSIKAYTIERISSCYHDQELRDTYSSASAIRNKMKEASFEEWNNQIPETNISLLSEFYQKQYPIYTNDFSLLLKYKLLQETKDSLYEYADVSEELGNRITKRLNEYQSFEQFCELLKTKELTYARINRALLHILLNIKKTSYQEINYARILGFQIDKSAILSEMKKSSSISLITKIADHSDLEMLTLDIKSSDLYTSVVTDKFQTPFQSEYQKQIIRQ